VVTTQKRIQYWNLVMLTEPESEYKLTYKNLLYKSSSGVRLLEFALAAVDAQLNQADEYIKVWLLCQSLWDLQPETLYNRLGSQPRAWVACLRGMNEFSRSFDTQDTQKPFGSISVDYTKVQSKVNVKHDAWHKDVLSRFDQLLDSEPQDFHGHVGAAAPGARRTGRAAGPAKRAVVN